MVNYNIYEKKMCVCSEIRNNRIEVMKDKSSRFLNPNACLECEYESECIDIAFSGEEWVVKGNIKKEICDSCIYNKSCLKTKVRDEVRRYSDQVLVRGGYYKVEISTIEKKSQENYFYMDKNGLKYLGEESEVIVPKTIKNFLVEKIASDAFVEKKVEKITIPKNVKIIDKGAFSNCKKLKEVILENDAIEIRDKAFSECTNLETIKLGNKKIKIEKYTSKEIYDIRIVHGNVYKQYRKKFSKVDTEEERRIEINNRAIQFWIEKSDSFKLNSIEINDRTSRYVNNEILKGYDDEVDQTETGLVYIEILNKGVNYRRQGKFELAKETYLKAIKMEPKKSVGYFNLGKILYILEEYEASVRAYKVAYELGELQDVVVNILEHMGHALIDPKYKRGRHEKAISDYSRGLKSMYGFQFTATPKILNEHKKNCIEMAKKYLKENR